MSSEHPFIASDVFAAHNAFTWFQFFHHVYHNERVGLWQQAAYVVISHYNTHRFFFFHSWHPRSTTALVDPKRSCASNSTVPCLLLDQVRASVSKPLTGCVAKR